MASSAQRTAVSALDCLAEARGIEQGYVDAYGQQRRIDPQVTTQLLAAIGIRMDSAQSLERELARAEQEAWARSLPHTVVLHRDRAPLTVPITLAQASRKISWRIILETGEVISERCDFQSLPLLESRRLGTIQMQRRLLTLRSDLPDGYHRLWVQDGAAHAYLIVSPGRCWLPRAPEDARRLWGVSLQLPLLRSDNNWGVGDFTDLARLMTDAAARGVEVVGVNPLHSGFPDAPEHASPYSPSSRLLLNVIFIDVTGVPGFRDRQPAQDLVQSVAFQRQLHTCRAAKSVQYAAVMHLKLSVLRVLFDRAREAWDWQGFEAFCTSQGDSLRLACLFQVLREHLKRLDPAGADWRSWPREFQQPASEAVSRFAAENVTDIQFHAWLQWHAERQLAAVEEAARGMAIGLYRDLAVGAHPGGAECWGRQEVMLTRLRVGAPPDVFHATGQDWGITPFCGHKLREEGYRSFSALLEANMRHAGALRIDHVMALQHLWCIPAGAAAAEGAYVNYNLEDLIGIVALESHRNECLIVGEDLGAVPKGFRERLREAQILSYRVLHFEREENDAFRPARSYPQLAIAVAGNHDLPTLQGWVAGRDLALRAACLPTRGTAHAEASGKRAREVALLQRLLSEEGLLAEEDMIKPEDHGAFIEAVHRFLARTPCLLAIVQLDDLSGELDPVNVPGTTAEYPNWRRKLSVTLEQLLDLPKWVPGPRSGQTPASPSIHEKR